MLLGTLTAVESALDAVLDIIEAAEPVRRRDAANRGRDAVDAAEDVGLRLMRAASWLRDGMRAPGGGLSGFGASGAGVGVFGPDLVPRRFPLVFLTPRPAPRFARPPRPRPRLPRVGSVPSSGMVGRVDVVPPPRVVPPRFLGLPGGRRPRAGGGGGGAGAAS